MKSIILKFNNDVDYDMFLEFITIEPQAEEPLGNVVKTTKNTTTIQMTEVSQEDRDRFLSDSSESNNDW